jgi:hypothetical protein
MDFGMILDYKHRNLEASDIVTFLKEEVQPNLQPGTYKVFVDFSYNRLNEVGLGIIVDFMESYPFMVVCVGYNSFTFSSFYNVVAGMKHSQWIESERIHMGTSEFDRKLDKVAALNMHTTGNLDKMQLNMMGLHTEMMGCSKMLKNVGKLADVALNTNGWATRLRANFEDVITTTLMEALDAGGYKLLDIVPDKYCKLPYHTHPNGVAVDGVQWDGVLFMERNNIEYTFLVKAKKTNNTKDMLTMPERVERTKSFMAFCSDPANMTHASKADKARCYIWSLYKDSRVRSAIGADVLPQSVLNMVKEHKMIRISLDPSGWMIVDEGDAITSD